MGPLRHIHEIAPPNEYLGSIFDKATQSVSYLELFYFFVTGLSRNSHDDNMMAAN